MSSYHRFLVKLISSFFFVGYLPLVPGTFGSLAGLAIFFFVKGSAFDLVFVTFIVTVLGFLASQEAEKVFNKKDDRRIVIDEVSGMLISLLFLPPDPAIIFFAFLIFRALDTLKPYPANGLQRLKGGLGVMSDDIVAGIYTNITLQMVVRFTTFKAS
ncbi:MAG: phosphatidylglycerophosphatase A [Candidatus Omnitrophica bacterium]|nr:phosphatidylglycerophosphatase A [Candidatus Omnitrophota bacterium]